MSSTTKFWNEKANHGSTPTKSESSSSNRKMVAHCQSMLPLPRSFLSCSSPPPRPPRIPGLLRSSQKRGRRKHSGPVCWCEVFCSMPLLLGVWCP